MTTATRTTGPRTTGASAGPPDRDVTARLAVDWTRCDGHGLCHALLPERIELDEWGFPILADAVVTSGEEADVRRAVAACPALALHLTRTRR